MAAVTIRDMFGLVRRAGREHSRARVLAELSRLIGERLLAFRVTVFVEDGERLIPMVAEYPSGVIDATLFARWREEGAVENSELGARIRADEHLLLIENPEDVLPARMVTAFRVQSLLAVALRTEDSLLGVLVVEGDFDELTAQQNEISKLAEIVTLTLETAQTFERERDRTREIEALLEVGTALTESTDLTRVLAAVARNSARVCGFERCSIMILDDSGRLEPVMSQFADGHIDVELWETFRRIEADLPAAGYVIESGVPVAYGEPETVPELNPSVWVSPFGIKSILMVPLTAWGENFGVLMLDHRERRSIGPDLVKVTQAVAAHGAAAIGLSRLLEREAESRRQAEAALRDLRDRQAQQGAVATVSQLALRAPDLGTLMEEAVRILAETLDVEYVQILEIQPGGEDLRLRAGVGWEDGLVGTATVDIGPGSQAGFTLAASSPVVVGDLASEHRFSGPDLLTDHEVVSGVSVIIGGRAEPYGVLGVYTIRHRAFTPEDIDFLRSVANVLGGAIEQERGERAVLESEQVLQAILDTASDAIVSVDENQRIFLFNQHASETFGYSQEEVLGEPLSMLLSNKIRSAHDGYVETLVREVAPRRLLNSHREISGLRKNGEEFPAEVTTSRTMVGDRTIFTAIVRDVTKQNELWRLVRESEDRYRSIFERSPIAIWEQDFTAVGAWLDRLRDDGVTDLRAYLTARPREVDHGIRLIGVLSVNPAGVDLIGAMSLDQLLEVRPEESRASSIREAFVTQFLAIWEDTDNVQLELVGRTAAGDRIECVLHFAVRRTDDGLNLSDVIVALTDITDRKAAEARLEELVKSKEELIASVSHEIRTPLTAIVGFAQLLQSNRAGYSESEHAEMLEMLVNESTDVEIIVEDLIVAAKADIGKLELMRVPVDLRAQSAQVLEMWDQGAAGHIELSGESVRCVGDAARVRQIIRNLVSNALRYGGDNVRAEVGSVDSVGYLRIVDDGLGVDAEDAEHIFESYQRGAKAPGLTAALGLGLGISRRLARGMNGDINYRRDRGETIFELTLPLVGSSDATATTGGSVPSGRSQD